MSTALAMSIFVSVLGPCIGSFIGVCAERIPANKSVIFGRSACSVCRVPLGWRELVPVVSFVSQRGRCRRCHASIPPWLLYLEIAAGGLGVLAALAGGDASLILLNALFLWLLLALAVIDVMSFRLPDPFTFGLGVVALAKAPDIEVALWGGFFGGASFLLVRLVYRAIRRREGLGLGDVKLMIGLGAATGPFDLPILVLLAAVFALAGAWITRGSNDGLGASRAVPFGAALCASMFCLWLAGVP